MDHDEKITGRSRFGRFYLDKEKDIHVELYRQGDEMAYILRTPNHKTGNLITNLARLCGLPVTLDQNGLKIIEGKVPCYIDGYNRSIYIFRLGNTKVANIFPDGTIEMKAGIPAISKTLMSQTKDYHLDIKRTITKTFIRSECKFRTDLHTHMNANLKPDILIALGIVHQIRYPLYYIKKLHLLCTPEQTEELERQRRSVAERFADSALTGKYLTRKIDDNTFINFADLILRNPADAEHNIMKIRASLSIMKDGQAVFTNLEKVYLYRYVFTKGISCDRKIILSGIDSLPDRDILEYAEQMLKDRENPDYKENTLFQDKLLWIARSNAAQGIRYLEISDTTLVKNPQAAEMLAQAHQVLPAACRETGVVIRFLAAIRRIALTIVKDNVVSGDYFRENLQVLSAVAEDPYVAGADIVGEEINDIRELQEVIREIVRIASEHPSFVIRIHAGENDSLRDNVANSIACVKRSLAEGQPMPVMRIGHGLYTANLKSQKGKALLEELKEQGVVLEFQITSNVRLNNLTSLRNHPLRAYLKAGVQCVQGTDGGALYGTDSIDEQLSLEKLLHLSPEEMLQLRRCEQQVCEKSMDWFRRKQQKWEQDFGEFCRETRDTAEPGSEERKPDAPGRDRDSFGPVEAYYLHRIAARRETETRSFISRKKLAAADILQDRICELPPEGMPVVVVGGSFNNDRHVTSVRDYGKRLLDRILEKADPEKVFFVIGYRLKGYERYLVQQNRDRWQGRFRIFAFIPTLITRNEETELRNSGVHIRVSIESSPMGLYKSLAFEIFKRRTSVLLALDGNSAGANMIQEARNAKYECRTYVSMHSRSLKTKAESLEGYVTLFADEKEVLPRILRDIGHSGF